ncbi:MAG: helix-turn-helix protein [Nonomuraea muscovyensis]|nr:helix-turn-helix protein [Nonomuraea muscovyensis]
MTTSPTPVAGLTTRPATGTKHLSPLTLERKRRALARLAGHPPFHPVAPVLDHIRKLNESGMSNDLIARHASVAQSTMSQVTRGLSKTMRRSTALRILAVEPGTFDEIANVPSLGSARRCQALYALGHSPIVIAATAGLSESAVMHIANLHYRKVSGATHRAITRAYAELSQQNGNSEVARSRARCRGWRDPLWWEDMGNIDNPDFDPADVERELNRDELATLRRQEIGHLMSYGFEHEQIADRLNMHVSTVRNIMAELRTGQRRDRGAVA